MKKHWSLKPATSAVLAGALLGCAFVVNAALPVAAGGPSTCSFSGGEVRVELEQDDSSGTLTLDNLGVAILYNDDGPPAAAEPCETATVSNTNKIVVEDVSDGGSSGIILDLLNGPFADGGAEIPIEIDLGSGPLDTFAVLGSTGADFWTFGSEGANLQQDSAAEIEFVRQPDLGLGSLRGGNDRACANGGRGTEITSQLTWLFSGGADDDRLCGGFVTDQLLGETGSDVLRGNGGIDTLKGGKDGDRLFGNASNDVLYGNEGSDELNGGPGSDVCKGGAGNDQKTHCE